MGDLDLPDYAEINRAAWNEDAPNWVERGRHSWASEPHWGEWQIPEAQLDVLPDVRGMDVIDLGCGTGYWSAWFTRLGASPTGIDVSEAQLATAAELQREHKIDFPLIHGSAEAVPLPDARFDLAFSEYGAAIWCDPYKWIPEAHRLLRPGGHLIFLANSVLSMLCAPPDDAPIGTELLRAQFGLHRCEWEDEPSIDFHLPHGEMLRLLRDTGFEVEALHELQAPEGEPDDRRFYMTRAWARQWPGEEIWVARKR
jgi:SAM-dependent methyltransferase